MISTDELTYVPAENTFYGEASTCRYYDGDIVVRSARTGVKIQFDAVGVERDAEGETTAFVFRPRNRHQWGCGTVKLFND